MNIFVDGSCYWKQQLGGAGVYFQFNGQEYLINKGYKNTTISRMEGRALYLALQSLSSFLLPIDEINIISDSEYVVKTFTEGRIEKWRKTNFFNVANADMWREIWKILNVLRSIGYKIEFFHIHSHQKDIQNDLVFGNSVADILSNYKNQTNFENDDY